MLTRLELSTTLEDDPDFKYERTLARFQCNLTYQYYFIVERRHWPIDFCQRITDLIQEQLTKRCNRAMGSDITMHPSLPDFPTAVPTRASFLAEYLSAVFRESSLHILGHLFLFSLLNIPVTFKSASRYFVRMLRNPCLHHVQCTTLGAKKAAKIAEDSLAVCNLSLCWPLCPWQDPPTICFMGLIRHRQLLPRAVEVSR
jgi:hypothetical protein